ncbi:uncharacterized protein M6B38_172930 [Iris pallida]|uniref:VQ domain-containing protein n=2 Tax=Iris pallida TaxID=29817 RepID=A0AAX6ETL2_IRIPA|nr:uncharacterized protein M6B38_172930 [Iris pallida]
MEIPSSSSSPNSSTSSSSSSNNGVVGVGVGAASRPPTPPPLTPKSASSIPPPHSNPYPTTFVQADTQSFKQMVQLLTGSAETAAKRQSAPPSSNPPPRNPIPPLNRAARKPSFKLYERRPSMKNLKMISPFGVPGPTTTGQISPAAAARSPLSPSILDFPSLALSPVTPLIPDPFDRSIINPNPNTEAEERAIAEKGFFLHPSPRPATPRDAEPPRLLPLFPLTSPRGSSSSSA